MAGHPGSDYFVQPTTGTIQQQDNPLFAASLHLLGFQGPMTWEQAQGVLELARKVDQSGAAPVTTQAGAAATGKVPNPLKGLAAIGDFFARLSNGNTWLRVAEVAAGVILLAVSLNKLLGNPAGKVSKAMPKVVPV